MPASISRSEVKLASLNHWREAIQSELEQIEEEIARLQEQMGEIEERQASLLPAQKKAA